jgi:cell division protease FtsH
MIDEEVKKMTDIAYAKTKQILISNKVKLTLLAEKLLEKEVIFKEDLEDIFGKRPFEKHDEIVVDSPKDIAAPSSEEGTSSEIITKDDDLSL